MKKKAMITPTGIQAKIDEIDFMLSLFTEEEDAAFYNSLKGKRAAFNNIFVEYFLLSK